MNHILNIIILLFIIVIIDIPMVGLINNQMYKLHFYRINNSELKINWLYAILAYITLAIGLYTFVIYPSIKYKYNITKSILLGALLGFVIYGLYNFTNKATIKKYGTYETLIDTMWGIIAFTIFTYIFISIFKNM